MRLRGEKSVKAGVWRDCPELMNDGLSLSNVLASLATFSGQAQRSSHDFNSII